MQEEEKIANKLLTFEPIDLEGLDHIKLLNRVDAKYIFHIRHFDALLDELKDHYHVLQIENKRMFAYESVYFDTDSYQLYRFHHNGKVNRMKVRFRKYIDSGLTFFEVKYKVKATRTDKHRIKVADIKDELSEKEHSFINHKQVEAKQLKRKLAIYFKRITLAGKNTPERATLDIGLTFKSTSASQRFPQLIVAEVKQDKNNVFSPMIQAFKRRHFVQSSFSKYSTGIALLEPIKNNAFKPNLLLINKILDGTK